MVQNQEFGVKEMDPQKVILDYLNSQEKKQIGKEKGFWLSNGKMLRDLSGKITEKDITTFWSYAEGYGIEVKRPNEITLHDGSRNSTPLYRFLDKPNKPKQAPALSSYDFTEEELFTVHLVYQAFISDENKRKDKPKEGNWYRPINKESLYKSNRVDYTEELDAKLRYHGYIIDSDDVLVFNWKSTDIEKLLYYEPSINEIYMLSTMLQSQLKYPEDFHDEITKEKVLSLQEPYWSKYLYDWLLRKKFVVDGENFEFNMKSNVLNYVYGKLQEIKKWHPEQVEKQNEAFKLLHNIHDYTDLQYVDDTKTFTMVDDTKQVVISTPEGSLLDLNKVIN